MNAADRPATGAHHGRRGFMLQTMLAAAPLRVAGAGPGRVSGVPIRAVAFDAFPHAVLAAAESVFPGKGQALYQSWFQKIFTDSWLRTSANRYLPFGELAAECLDYACRSAMLEPDASARERLVTAFSNLGAWPDAAAELDRLRTQGIRLVVLSNMTEPMLRANLMQNRLASFFEAVLSTDLVGAYKPAPRAYALAMRALGLPKRQIGFAAFGAWDAAGASWFGYPTAWVNRQPQQPEPGAPRLLTGGDMSVVTRLVRESG